MFRFAAIVYVSKYKTTCWDTILGIMRPANLLDKLIALTLAACNK